MEVGGSGEGVLVVKGAGGGGRKGVVWKGKKYAHIAIRRNIIRIPAHPSNSPHTTPVSVPTTFVQSASPGILNAHPSLLDRHTYTASVRGPCSL
jgi:hypothetical protein